MHEHGLDYIHLPTVSCYTTKKYDSSSCTYLLPLHFDELLQAAQQESIRQKNSNKYILPAAFEIESIHATNHVFIDTVAMTSQGCFTPLCRLLLKVIRA